MKNSRIRLEFKGSCLKQDKVTFTPNNVFILFLVYELYRWPKDISADFTLKDCLFGAVKITKNADPDKYSYSGYGIGCDSFSLFSISNFDRDNNVIIFGVDMGLSAHIDDKNKDILIIDEGTTQGLDNTTLIILH